MYSFKKCLLLFVLFFISCGEKKKVIHDANSSTSGIGYALIVGVSQTTVKGYDPISGVSRNIEKMDEILKARGFVNKNIHTLMEKPAAGRIMQVLKKKLQSLSRDDLFVFYFFGHGGQKNDDEIDEESDSLDEFLVTYNGIILDDELNEILKDTKPKGRVVFIIESCHSGSLHQVIKGVNISDEIIEVDENNFPNFIYLGATTDPKEAPLYSGGGIYTDRLYRIWVKKNGKNLNYRQFQKELNKLKQKPVLIDTYASDSFINQLFLKI